MFKLRFTFFLLFIITTLSSFAQEDDEYMNAYILVADTSTDYFKLRDEMFALSASLKITVDTLGRGYDTKKNLICFPDDSDDEIYAGCYTPRRYPTKTLSLEYLSYYKTEKLTDNGTIAIIVLITDNEDLAQSHLKQVKEYFPDSFVINTPLYMGCVH